MEIVVFGASGQVGRLVVRQALEQGHTVTAFARTPAKLAEAGVSDGHARLRVVQGDVRDAGAVAEAVRGRDAVVSAVGMTKTSGGDVLAVARDTTEERARDEVRRMLEAALARLPDAISITTEDGVYLYRNPAHADLLGYDPGADPGNARDFLPDEDSAEQLRAIQKELRTQGRWQGRVRRRRPDGRIVTASLMTAEVPGDTPTFFSVLRDASEEIARERHLRRVERLASLGTLIGGVAPEDVTREQRTVAKAVNFGIVYGQSAFGLSQALGIPPKEAGEFINRYFARYANVRRFIDQTIAEAHAAMKAGRLTCRALVDYYLQRIEAFDKRGPAINAIIVANPNAAAEADELDLLGPLALCRSQACGLGGLDG